VAAVTGAAAPPTSTTAAAEASSPEAEAEGADSSRRMADIRADSETADVKCLYCIFFKKKKLSKNLGPRAEINIYTYIKRHWIPDPDPQHCNKKWLTFAILFPWLLLLVY
jgi:hypothetical protein